MSRKSILLLIGFALTLILPMTAAAQTTQIEYGNFTIANLDQNLPAAFFNFNGTEGDLIMVEAVALSGSLNPRITLLTAGSTTLAVNNDDPFQPGSTDARLTYRLPSTGSFSILVEAEADTDGQYLLRLERRDLPPSTPLAADVITTANVSPDVPAQVYNFDSSVANTVSVRSPVSGFQFVAAVFTPDGQTLSIHNGGVVGGGSTSVSPNTGTYTLVIRAGTPNASGGVEVEFTSGAGPVAPVQADAGGDDTTTAEGETTTDPVAPPPTPVPSDETAPPPAEGDTTADGDGGEGGDEGGDLGAATVGGGFPTNRCNVSPSDGGVVIRQGPDTDFPAIASIPIGEFRFADGTDGAWIRLVGGGWVSSGVVDLNGPCGALPIVTGDAPPSSGDGGEAPPPPPPTTVAPVGER
jgi:hypothetical protein